MEYYKSQIEKGLSDLEFVIEIFEQNAEIFPLFKFNKKYEGDLLQMLDGLMFEENIIHFFNLVLSSYKAQDAKDGKGILPPTDGELRDFINIFISDIKMSLLKDAVINLSNYFVGNSRDKSNSKVKFELFYNSTSLRDEFNNFTTKMNLADDYGSSNVLAETQNGISTILADLENQMEFRMPKIVFPWYAYAFGHTYKSFPPYSNRKNIFIVDSEILSLKWKEGSNCSSSNEDFLLSQKKFIGFIKTISDKKSLNKNEFNQSLNLFLFNETTNLYDMFNLVSIFCQNPSIMEELNFKSLFDTKKLNNRERDIRKQNIFKVISNIATNSNLGLKTLLINKYYNEKLFMESRVWRGLEKIFAYCKTYLLKVIEAHQKYKDNPGEEGIQIDLYIYRQLQFQEPYIDMINIVIGKEIPIYCLSNNKFESLSKEVYHYVYKCFCETQFKEGKIQNHIKY